MSNRVRDQAAYEELYLYTMGRKHFILQHVVDAHTAQRVDAGSTPILERGPTV